MARRAARWRGSRAGALAVVLLSAPGARAAAPVPAPELPVHVTGCADEIAIALPALVSLEIDVLLRERGATRGPPESITVRCAEDAADIEVALGGTRRASRIALGALAPEHRARAVALAAAEIVDAMSSRASAPGADGAPPAATVAPAVPADQPGRDAAEASARPEGRRALVLGPVAEWLGRPAQMLFGARLAFLYPASDLITPALSLDVSFGDFPSGSGQVTARTFGGAAHVYFGVAAGKLRLDAGPGARVGWVRLHGEAPAGSALDGRALSAAWAGPELRARVAYSPFRSSLIALELGAGIVALQVRGLVDGATRAYSIEGTWLSACLQAGMAW